MNNHDQVVEDSVLLQQIAEPSSSTWRLVWHRFLHHKLAMLSGSVIMLLILSALLAPWLSPYDFSGYNIHLIFTPPTVAVPKNAERTESCIRPAVLLWRCGMHPFGTDDLGRDTLTRVLYGGRVSLLVGFTVALATALFGGLLGIVAAYFGGPLDTIISRIIDIMLSIPVFPLLLILSGLLVSREVPLLAYLSKTLGAAESIVIIITVITILSWMLIARLTRSEALSLRNQDFIEAARAIGASHSRIILHHLLPNTLHLIIVQATLQVGDAILIASGLSFLGLGIQPPAVSWGNMLSRAQEFFYYPNGIYAALLPGLFISLTVLSFNFFGDGIRDALDPRWKR